MPSISLVFSSNYLVAASRAYAQRCYNSGDVLPKEHRVFRKRKKYINSIYDYDDRANCLLIYVYSNVSITLRRRGAGRRVLVSLSPLNEVNYINSTVVFVPVAKSIRRLFGLLFRWYLHCYAVPTIMIINPRRACAARVTVGLSVCLFVYDYSRIPAYERYQRSI